MSSLILYFVILPVIVYFWDPKDLRRFPAPSLWGVPAWAGWSNGWLAVVIAKYARSEHVQAAHDRYGSVVRIQPSHLSFVDPDAAKDIYSFQAKMMKDDAYETFSGPDAEGHNFKSIVNTPDREEHSRKRKYISNAFAQRTVVTLDPLVNRAVSTFVKQLDKVAAGELNQKTIATPGDGVVNLYRWINLLAYDIVGEISFGQSFGLCERGDDVMEALPFSPKESVYKASIIDSFQAGNIYDCFFGPWPKAVHTLKSLTQWHWNAKKNKVFGEFVNMQARQRLDRGNPQGYRDFMSYFLESGKGEKLDLEYGEVWREAAILLAGGSDTSTSSMTYTMYLLLKNPDCLRRLREEIDPVLAGTTTASYDQVSNLPYLRACVEEALRVHPPVGQGLPRVVPDGGATVAGHKLKGKKCSSFPVISFPSKHELPTNTTSSRHHRLHAHSILPPQPRYLPLPLRLHPRPLARRRHDPSPRPRYPLLNRPARLHRQEYILPRSSCCDRDADASV